MAQNGVYKGRSGREGGGPFPGGDRHSLATAELDLRAVGRGGGYEPREAVSGEGVRRDGGVEALVAVRRVLVGVVL